MLKSIVYGFLAVALIAGTATTTEAQQKPKQENKGAARGKGAAKREEWRNMTPDQRAQAATDRMTKRYALSAEQGAKLKATNLDFTDKMAGVKALRETNKEQWKIERKKLRDEHHAAIKGILTAEQNTKYEADLAKVKERHEARRKAHANGKGKPAGTAPKTEDANDDVYEILGGSEGEE